MEKEHLIHGRTCVYNINYHLVWSVKYRRKVLTAEVESYLKDVIQAIAQEKEFVIAPSYIAKMLKRISGRRLLLKFPEITKKLWKGHLWNPSYYLETIGSVSEESIKKYLERQTKGGEMD